MSQSGIEVMNGEGWSVWVYGDRVQLVIDKPRFSGQGTRLFTTIPPSLARLLGQGSEEWEKKIADEVERSKKWHQHFEQMKHYR